MLMAAELSPGPEAAQPLIATALAFEGPIPTRPGGCCLVPMGWLA